MPEQTNKRFPTLSVAEVYTGFVLQKPSGLHEVMDHLYPGIMTLGTGAMQPTASKYLGKAIPDLAALGKPTEKTWKEYAVKVVEKLGDTLEVPGPHSVDKVTVRKAFDQFGKS